MRRTLPLVLLVGCTEQQVAWNGFWIFLAVGLAWGALDLWGRLK